MGGNGEQATDPEFYFPFICSNVHCTSMKNFEQRQALILRHMYIKMTVASSGIRVY